MAKKNLMMGAAVLAISAIMLPSLLKGAKAQDDLLSPEMVQDFDAVSAPPSVPIVPLAENWQHSLVGNDPHLMPPEMRRFAAGAMLSALLAGIVRLFGVSNLVALLAGLLKGFGKVAKAVVKGPVKAAKVVAKATGNLVAGPGKWLLLFGGLAIFAMTGVVHFDLQMQMGVLLGAGVTAITVYGIGKTLKASQAMRLKTVSVFDAAMAKRKTLMTRKDRRAAATI